MDRGESEQAQKKKGERQMTIHELWHNSNMSPNTNIVIYTYDREKAIYTGKFETMPNELYESEVWLFIVTEVKNTYITDMEIVLDY